MTIAIADIKLRYLPKYSASIDLDATIGAIKDDVVLKVIDYLDNASYTTEADLTGVLAVAVMKQTAYEVERRRDLGLTSVTAPDGTLSKFASDDWLTDVKETLDRYTSFTLAQTETT